jgi:hypothetical protein
VIKLSLAALALRSRPGRAAQATKKHASGQARREPLPPIVALEGNPDPSLRRVIEDLASRLGASICPIEGPASLASDPDLDAVIAVILTRARSPLELQITLREARGLLGDRPLAVLAPQPLASAFGGVLPIDPSCVAPPITVDRLLFALGLADNRGV